METTIQLNEITEDTQLLPLLDGTKVISISEDIEIVKQSVLEDVENQIKAMGDSYSLSE